MWGIADQGLTRVAAPCGEIEKNVLFHDGVYLPFYDGISIGIHMISCGGMCWSFARQVALCASVGAF